MKKHTDPIDWSFWQHMPALLWQACALSLSINPDNMHGHPQGWMAGPGRGPLFTHDSFPNDVAKAKFDRRLRLLGEHYQSEIFTDIDNSNAGGSHLAKVTIQNFAKWGLDVNLKDMPPELIAMAQQHNKGKVRDDGLVRLDALILEISTEWIAKNPAVPQKSLKASVAAAYQAHAGQPLEHVQAMAERGEITLRGVISRIPPPLPPKIEHIADWLLSTPDAEKVRAKLRALSAVDELATVAPAESKPQSEAKTDGFPNDATIDDWKVKARQITDRIGLKKWESGIREITARNICEAVATELAKDITTHGTRGPRSSSSVRTVGLRGWKFKPPKE